jgi:hypothetical protein
MPRPKRTKIAPSIPVNRGAKLNGRHINPKDVVEDISDEEEGRATGAKSLMRSRGRSAHPATENPQSVTQNTGTNDSENAKALERMKKRRDAAMRRLEAENNTSTEQAVSLSEQVSSSPAVEFGRRAIATSAENSLLAIGNFRRRTRQPSILGRKESRARSSSVESNLAESNGLTNVPVEGSVLARGTFKRRQRQPSILGRAASRVRSSSVGLEIERTTPGNSDSAVRTGMFKRRSRQPSILGTGKKDHRRRLESDYDDEDDFNPDDESTPLNLSKTRSTGQQGSQSMSTASNPRKRKLSSLQPSRSSPPISADDSEPQSPDPSTSPSQNPATEEVIRPSTPEPLSDTMAPPRSSSSPTRDSPEVLLPSRRTNIQPRGRSVKRQPVRKPLAPPGDESLPSSPPSLTHSPNRAETPVRQGRAPTRPRANPANLSTVQLQALLPRRRRRHARDTFDIESSDDGEVDPGDLGSDDDELTYLTTRTNRTTRSAAPRSVARLKPGPSVSAKSKAKATPAIERLKASAKKTYRSRHTVSDKENESDAFDEDLDVDPDDSLAPIRDSSPEDSQDLEERVGKELKTAKKKFEVVDKWELEFEDVTAGSSSPWDAR